MIQGDAPDNSSNATNSVPLSVATRAFRHIGTAAASLDQLYLVTKTLAMSSYGFVDGYSVLSKCLEPSGDIPS